MRPLILTLSIFLVGSVCLADDSAVSLAKRVIRDKSDELQIATRPVSYVDSKKVQAEKASTQAEAIIEAYVLSDSAPEKVTIAYAIRVLADRYQSIYYASKREEIHKNIVVLSERLQELENAEQDGDGDA
ncbi:hypothetical protein ACFQY0_20975 [Haloferula chungangensis]|uniref:Uncharacterized protein n=1 Tax=Haloferula chungangensis TaxID=1048331 RepID=A0ABW2LDS9_9BACT